MITRTSVVVAQTNPDLSQAVFTQVLKSAGSPALAEAPACYNEVVRAGVSPAFALAIFNHESDFGLLGFAGPNKNPGNTRTSTTGIGIQVTTVKGKFIRYPNWREGFRDMAWRLVKPNYDYALEGRKTIEQIITRWAPPSENDTETYITSVVNFMNEWVGTETEEGATYMQDPTNKIDIVHPNKGRNGASPQIIVLHVQDGLNYLPDFFRQSGDDSTMWCMRDGTLVRMEQDTDSAWTNGYMSEPLDHTNPVIQSLYNQGVRNSNNYSLTIEHQGFSTGAFTDAAIESTAKMCAYWMNKYGWTAPGDVNTRIVGHYQIGEHKNCPGPNFPWSKLRARVTDLVTGATKLNINQGPGPIPAPQPQPFNPNPKGFNVGSGVLEVLTAEGMTAITNENYFSAPGQGQRSFTYCQDGAGVTYQVEAIEEVDGDGKPTGPWTRQLYKFIREYK